MCRVDNVEEKSSRLVSHFSKKVCCVLGSELSHDLGTMRLKCSRADP